MSEILLNDFNNIYPLEKDLPKNKLNEQDIVRTLAVCYHQANGGLQSYHQGNGGLQSYHQGNGGLQSYDQGNGGLQEATISLIV
jgi:hypothetical protein